MYYQITAISDNLLENGSIENKVDTGREKINAFLNCTKYISSQLNLHA